METETAQIPILAEPTSYEIDCSAGKGVMPHKMLARTIGTAWHKFVETNDEHVECELPVEWNELVGTADIVYRDGRIVDNKTTRWLSPSKLPYGSHALQVNIYAFMLRQMGREVRSLAIQYIDMSGPTKCRACRLPVEMVDGNLVCPRCGSTPKDAHLGVTLVDIPLMTDVDVLDEIHDKIKNLQAAIDLGMPPEASPFTCAVTARTKGTASSPSRRFRSRKLEESLAVIPPYNIPDIITGPLLVGRLA